ncbi:uncharacterized protein [Apostichopus japonicus]|uniref:uncharacterized protein isoform X3 n=1 Tax=Stichopus japonicus TaxID=307972 RepID=UPI003AB1872F
MYSFGNIIFFAITLVSPISLDAGNVCTDGTGFTQCGAPPLTAEQIANIDTDRVNELRNTMMNLPNGRGPLVENHPDISPNLLQPIVNFTDEQLAVYESKYPRLICILPLVVHLPYPVSAMNAAKKKYVYHSSATVSVLPDGELSTLSSRDAHVVPVSL